MRKLKSIMLAGAMLLATPVFFSSCQEDAPKIKNTMHVNVINDFSKVVEAINNGAIKNAEAIGKLTAAIDKMDADQKDKLQSIIEAINSVNNTLGTKLALIEAAMKAQTISLEGKLDLLEQAIKNMPKYDEQLQAIVAAINGLPRYDEQLKAIDTIISSVNSTLSTKLAAIEAIIKAQTLSMEGKFDALEAAIKAMPDNRDEIKALKSEIADLILAVKNGTASEKNALETIIQKLEALKGSLGIGGGSGDVPGNATVYSTEYVDLGLPSGKLWAKCNLGAGSPEQSGEYYAWGELNQIPNSYKGRLDDGGDGYIKYTPSDGLTRLEPEDDAATYKLGGNWHIPGKDDLDELLDNCQVSVATLNGVKGIAFRGPNGNEIFFPATGCQAGVVIADLTTVYITTRDRKKKNVLAYWGYFYDVENNRTEYNGDYFWRYVGQPIRPVCDYVVNPDKPEVKPEAVDLGLPSGTKWASHSLGATEGWQEGDLYAWGELHTKLVYSKRTYKWYDFVKDEFTKYNKEDEKYTLDPEDDVATQKLGDGWRMPTAKEIKELYDNVTMSTFRVGGKPDGDIYVRLKSKINDNYIDFKLKTFIISNQRSDIYNVNGYIVNDNNLYDGWMNRTKGNPVRAVYTK